MFLVCGILRDYLYHVSMFSPCCRLQVSCRRKQDALQAFQDGKSCDAYRPRSTIEAATSSSSSGNSWQKTSDVCCKYMLHAVLL